MAQRVAYEQLPGTRFDQYIFKLRLVLGYLNQPGGTKFKGFRDFLRKQNLWDKDKSEVVFALPEITWDKTHVKLGKTAKKLLAAHSDNDFQNILFERLKELNILLVKYVLEALDVTQGGRLHSVHELYRMITSYVYPGAYITLTAFQAWVEWLAASGYIKLVGIRWALSDKGQKIVSELRAMDVDEIMEDMEGEGEEEGGEEEEEAEEDEDEAPAPAPVAVAPSKFAKPPLPQPAPPKPAQAAASDDIDDDEDLFADLPPEAEAPDEEAVRAASARLGLEDDEGDEDEEAAPPKPMAPKYTPPASLAPRPKADKAPGPVPAPKPVKPAAAPPVAALAAAPAASAALHAPLAAPSYTVVPVSALGGAGEAELVDRVVGMWQALGDWPAFTADKLGVVHQPGAGDLALLIELGVIASLVEGLEPQPQVFAFVKRLRETTFFASLGHGEGLEEGLDALERLGREPWARPLFERLVHARFIARRVGMKIDLLYQLRQAASGREVVDLLREHLTGPDWVEAPFWVARELARLGVLKEERLRSAVAVPTRRLVANAARIGLARVGELRDRESLTALSEAVSALSGTPEAGFGEALANLDRGLGLTV
jgi:hypothetical protein